MQSSPATENPKVLTADAWAICGFDIFWRRYNSVHSCVWCCKIRTFRTFSSRFRSAQIAAVTIWTLEPPEDSWSMVKVLWHLHGDFAQTVVFSSGGQGIKRWFLAIVSRKKNGRAPDCQNWFGRMKQKLLEQTCAVTTAYVICSWIKQLLPFKHWPSKRNYKPICYRRAVRQCTIGTDVSQCHGRHR